MTDTLWNRQQKAEHNYFAEEKDKDFILAEQVAKGHCSRKAIEKILYRKQRWIDLQEDLLTIEKRL